MKTTHTPGPWSIGKNYHNEDNNRIDIHCERGDFKDKAMLAIVRTTDSERAKADARLIAAAPDLLKTLTEIDLIVVAEGALTIIKGSPFHLALQEAVKKTTI